MRAFYADNNIQVPTGLGYSAASRKLKHTSDVKLTMETLRTQTTNLSEKGIKVGAQEAGLREFRRMLEEKEKAAPKKRPHPGCNP